MTATLRVLSWNVHYLTGDAADREGDFLASLDPPPDVLLLQEVNRRSAELLRRAAGLEWLRLAIELRQPNGNETPAHQRGVAIGARAAKPISFGLLERAPFSERAMHAVIKLDR